MAISERKINTDCGWTSVAEPLEEMSCLDAEGIGAETGSETGGDMYASVPEAVLAGA